MRSPSHTVAWILVLVVGIFLLVMLDGQARRTEPERDPVEKGGYLPSAGVALVSFGLEPLVADYLWIDAVQYLGHTLAHHKHGVQDGQIIEIGFTGDQVTVAAENLYDLVKRVTEVDPHFIYPYYITALFLFDRHAMPDGGLDLLRQGVSNNPEDWLLRAFYGLQLFLMRYDVKSAEHHLEIAAQLPGAPSYIDNVRQSLLTESHTQLRVMFLRGALMRAGSDMERRKIQEELDELQSGEYRSPGKERDPV